VSFEETEANEFEDREEDEARDLKNGATELTEETDPLFERFPNSTRARFARVEF
jgi:hypothetical protein